MTSQKHQHNSIISIQNGYNCHRGPNSLFWSFLAHGGREIWTDQAVLGIKSLYLYFHNAFWDRKVESKDGH